MFMLGMPVVVVVLMITIVVAMLSMLTMLSMMMMILMRWVKLRRCRFQAAGAKVIRVDAYETRPGAFPESCEVEKRIITDGAIDAIAFTSTAEVR
jgi:hypothetical protein